MYNVSKEKMAILAVAGAGVLGAAFYTKKVRKAAQSCAASTRVQRLTW